MEIYTLLSR